MEVISHITANKPVNSALNLTERFEMEVNMQILLLIAIAYNVISKPYHSYFLKSKVINYTCDRSHKIKTIFAPRNLACAEFCSLDPNCRRYLYCKMKGTCTLYLDASNCYITTNSTDCSCYRKTIGCNEENCTCPWGYYGKQCEHIITDCADGANRNIKHDESVISFIKPATAPSPFEVVCLFNHVGLTSILERRCGYEDFNRTMEDYKTGFGVPWYGWLGLNKISQIIDGRPSATLYILISETSSDFCDINYYGFTLLDNFSFFITGSDYGSGACANALDGNLSINGLPFSTYDSDFTVVNKCASLLGGGWWFADTPECTEGFLTGSLNNATRSFWMGSHIYGDIVARLIF